MGEARPSAVTGLDRHAATDVHQLRAGRWSASQQYLHRIGRNPTPDCERCGDVRCRGGLCPSAGRRGHSTACAAELPSANAAPIPDDREHSLPDEGGRSELILRSDHGDRVQTTPRPRGLAAVMLPEERQQQQQQPSRLCASSQRALFRTNRSLLLPKRALHQSERVLCFTERALCYHERTLCRPENPIFNIEFYYMPI